MAGIHFDITGDNSNFMSRLREVENGVRATSKNIEQSGMSVEALFGRLTKAAAGFGAAFSAQQFVQQVVQVRGQFQQLEVAFKTILGSAEKADALMQQLVRTAAATPFDLRGVTQGAKQLLAYGTAAEDVNETIVRLGDIAAGLSIPLNDLVYLYGTTMTQGRMFSVDFKQFLGRGIPLAEELAKQFGVAKDEVGELVTAGKVGAEEFQKAIWSMTNEGGKFGGLMEAQSKTITGQISNIQDAIVQMFNDIGQSSEGAINTALDSVSYLVANYEKVGREIMALVAAYGAYKAVLMSVAAYQGAVTAYSYSVEAAELSKLVPLKQASANADVTAAVASGRLTEAEAAKIVAIRGEIQTKMQQLTATKASADAEVAAAMAAHKAALQRALAAKQAYAAKEKELLQLKVTNAYLYEQIKGTQLAALAEERHVAVKARKVTAQNLAIAKSKQAVAAQAVETFQTNVSTASNTAHTRSLRLLVLAKWKLVAASKALGLSMLANPYVLAAAAVAGLTYGIYKLVTAETAAEKATRKHREEQEKFAKTLEDRRSKIDELIRIIQDETQTEFAQVKAYEELSQLSPALTQAYTRQELAVADLTEANKKLNAEQDKMSYDNIIANIDKYKKQLDSLEEHSKRVHVSAASSEYYRIAIKQAKENLKTWENNLNDYNRIQAKVAEEAKPARVKLLEAESSKEQIDQEFENAKKALEEAQKKASENWMFTVPIELIANYNAARQRKIDNDANITSLSSQLESNKEQSYKEAFKAAEDDWKAKKKAVEDAKKSGSAAAYKKAVKELEDAEKTYKDLGGKTEKQQNKEYKDRIKAQDELDKQLEKLLQDNEQDRIALLKDGAEKELAQIKANHAAKIAEIEREAKELAEKNKEVGTTDLNSEGLTAEQNDWKVEAIRLANEEQKKATSDLHKSELQAMRDYLKEYGSLEQQKLAITEEYEQKIADAKTKGEKLSLQKEKEETLSKLSFENISMGIDWKALFSGVDSMSKEMLQPMMEQLIAFTKTEDYAKADSQTQSDVAELIKELRSYLGTDTSVTWETLAVAIDNFNRSVTEYKNAVGAEKATRGRVEQGKKDLADGKITQEEYDAIAKEADALSEATVIAKESMNGFATELNDTSEEIKNFTSALSTELKNAKTWRGIDGFGAVEQSAGNIGALKGALDSVLPNMADGMGKNIATSISGSLGSFGSSLTGMLSKGIGPVVGTIAQIPQLILGIADAIKNFATGIINGFTALFELRWIDELVNSILGAIGNLINAIFDLPENLYKVLESIVVQGVGGLLDTALGRIGNVLTLGALSSDGVSSWFKGSNAGKVIEKLQKSIESATAALDIWKDRLEDSRDIEAAATAEEAVRLQEQINNDKLEQARARARYWGKHKSWGHYWEGFSDEQIADFSEQIGRDWDGSLWNLSPEEMKQLSGNVDMVNAIKNTGKGGYGEKMWAKLENYAAEAGKLDEIWDTLREKITNTTFDSFFDSFVDGMRDMSKATEDFADDFVKAMTDAAYEARIEEIMGDDLEAFWKSWAKAAEDGLTKEEAEYHKNWYQRLAEQAETERDKVYAVTGYNPEEEDDVEGQQRSQTGVESISDETAKALEGRATAIQISNTEQTAHLATAVAELYSIASIQTSGNVILSNILTQHVVTNSYLEDMVKHTKTMQGFGTKLDTMIEIFNKRL